MAVMKGREFFIFMKMGSQFKAVAMAKNHTLVIRRDSIETSSKDSGKWGDKEPGKITWSATSESFCDSLGNGSAHRMLHEKMMSGEKLDIIATVASNADNDAGLPAGGWIPKAGDGYKGQVFITEINMNTPDSDNATMTVSMEGCGPLLPSATTSTT